MRHVTSFYGDENELHTLLSTFTLLVVAAHHLAHDHGYPGLRGQYGADEQRPLPSASLADDLIRP